MKPGRNIEKRRGSRSTLDDDHKRRVAERFAAGETVAVLAADYRSALPPSTGRCKSSFGLDG